MTAHPRTTARGRPSRHGTWVIGAAVVPAAALTLGAFFGTAPVHAADPPAAFAPMYIGGNYFRKDLPASKYTILGTFVDLAIVDRAIWWRGAT